MRSIDFYETRLDHMFSYKSTIPACYGGMYPSAQLLVTGKGALGTVRNPVSNNRLEINRQRLTLDIDFWSLHAHTTTKQHT